MRKESIKEENKRIHHLSEMGVNINDTTKQRKETIDKVVRWLREEGYNPEDKTVEYPDTKFFANVMISEKEAFHVLFPKDRVDSVIIFRIIAMDKRYQQAYKSLPPIQQNRFFFDLKIALLQMNVMYFLEKGIREFESLRVTKVIYFDGLTKDRLFDTIYTVSHAIEMARTKLGLFRDSILPSQAGQHDDWRGTI